MQPTIHKEAWHKIWKCVCGEIFNAGQHSHMDLCNACARPKSARKAMARAHQYTRTGLLGGKRYIEDKIMEIPKGEE